MSIKINNQNVVNNNEKGEFLIANIGAYTTTQLTDGSVVGTNYGDFVYNKTTKVISVWSGRAWSGTENQYVITFSSAPAESSLQGVSLNLRNYENNAVILQDGTFEFTFQQSGVPVDFQLVGKGAAGGQTETQTPSTLNVSTLAISAGGGSQNTGGVASKTDSGSVPGGYTLFDGLGGLTGGRGGSNYCSGPGQPGQPGESVYIGTILTSNTNNGYGAATGGQPGSGCWDQYQGGNGGLGGGSGAFVDMTNHTTLSSTYTVTAAASPGAIAIIANL